MTQGRKRKANHQGHSYKVGNSWRTVIRVNGKTISANAPTQQESRKKAKEKLVLSGTSGAKNLGVRELPLEEYLAKWLVDEHSHKIAYSTQMRYQGLIAKYINPLIGAVDIRELNQHHVLNVLKSMAMLGQSARSQQQARALLSVALNSAVDSALISHNPVKLTKNVSLDYKPITPLTQAEVKRILDATQGTFQHARLHVALLLGLRQGEALGLRWQDIDFSGNSIRVHNQVQKVNGKRIFTPLKTRSSNRTIMFGAKTSEALGAHRLLVDAMKVAAGEIWVELDLVFPNRYGEPIQSKWDYDRWIKQLKDCGIAKRNLHCARHTAGTLLYSSGADIETIRRVLGHSSISLTSRTYVHSAEEPLRKAANALDKILQ